VLRNDLLVLVSRRNPDQKNADVHAHAQQSSEQAEDSSEEDDAIKTVEGNLVCAQTDIDDGSR
jgi:hypothetical protein